MQNKILIIDSNLKFITSLYNCIEYEKISFNIVCLNLKWEEILSYINLLNPYVIFLNMESIMNNETYVLEELSNLNIKIFLILNEITLINKVNLIELKNICKVYIQPLNLAEIRKDFLYLSIQDNKTKISNLISNNNSERLESLVIQQLTVFNFNKSSIGYKYLVISILEILKDTKKLENIEQHLFPNIAQKLKITNPMQIKWSLQKTIDSMVRYTENSTLHKYFPYTNKPTIKTFLSTINRIMLDNYN